MSKQEISKLFGCTIDQLNNQYKANAEILQQIADKAKGKKSYRNATSEEWKQYADKYKKLAE